MRLNKSSMSSQHRFPHLFSFFFFSFCCCCCCCFFTPASSSSPPKLNLWPFPAKMSWQTPEATTFLSPSFQIVSPNTTHKYLSSAMRRYARLVLSEKHHPIVPPPVDVTATSSPLQCLTVRVCHPSSPLQHGVDESYSLSIPYGGVAAHLRAETVWGAMRGLETFSQLVWGDPPRVPVGVEVEDFPLFPHRGLLLDTSRNYYPVEDILRTVRAMAANKLNVFHWHITDSHSFPIVLPSEPGLAANGSYGPAMVYTPADVKKVVEFGMRHGVRILPEIDTPGHAASWAGAYPEIVTCENMFWMPPGAGWEDRLASEPGPGQLNPLHPRTYQVVRNVISDVAALFSERFFHAGADEVVPGCWKTDPAIQHFLAGGGTLGDLLEKFINATLPYIASLNRTAVYWADVLLDGTVRVDPSTLPPETAVLQTWVDGPNSTKAVTAAGYRAIVSSSDFYYLDCGHGDFMRNDSRYDRQEGDDPGQPFNYGGGSGGSWCGPFKTWQRVYDYDITHGLSEEQAGRVLGGEVALWSEQADAVVLDGRVWPRASAMAEALWSGNRDGTGRKRYAEAAGRLGEWRRRMVGRGVRAEPIEPLWCATRPGMCNLSE